MRAYQIRFLNERGGTLLLYFARCSGDEDARSRVGIATNYARFEIWQDDRQVEAGRGKPYLH